MLASSGGRSSFGATGNGLPTLERFQIPSYSAAKLFASYWQMLQTYVLRSTHCPLTTACQPMPAGVPLVLHSRPISVPVELQVSVLQLLQEASVIPKGNLTIDMLAQFVPEMVIVTSKEQASIAQSGAGPQ